MPRSPVLRLVLVAADAALPALDPRNRRGPCGPSPPLLLRTPSPPLSLRDEPLCLPDGRWLLLPPDGELPPGLLPLWLVLGVTARSALRGGGSGAALHIHKDQHPGTQTQDADRTVQAGHVRGHGPTSAGQVLYSHNDNQQKQRPYDDERQGDGGVPQRRRRRAQRHQRRLQAEGKGRCERQ